MAPIFAENCGQLQHEVERWRAKFGKLKEKTEQTNKVCVCTVYCVWGLWCVCVCGVCVCACVWCACVSLCVWGCVFAYV